MPFLPRIVTPDGPSVLGDGRPGEVCIVLLSGIGDVVHGLPLALDLKALLPETRVTWVAEPAPAQVLAHHPGVDRVVVYRSRDGFAGLRALRRDMADVHADVTLNVQRYLKSVWPTLLSGARVRVGLPPSKTRDGVRFSSTHVLQDGPWKHSQDLFLDFRWALGVPRAAPVRWEITLSDQEQSEARAWADTFDARPLVALVLGSANPKKDWPARRYAELADTLDRDLGFSVVLLGGPSDRERRAAEEVVRLASTRPVDALTDSVRTLMARIGTSALVVAPDTGPLHIAHAMGIPVVGIFGHTNPWRVGPWRDFHDLVVDGYTEPGDDPDPGAYLPKDGRMDAITVEAVLAKVEVARWKYL